MGMRRIWKFVRGKFGIPSGRVIVHFVVVEAVLQAMWWGAGKVFSMIPEVVKGWGFLAVFIAAIFAVAWYLPKLSPALYSFRIGVGKIQPTKPTNTRLTYDNVLWEDAGSDGWGGIRVTGPFCPKDFTPLAMKRGWDKIVDTDVREQAYYWERGECLFCLECKTEYVLSENPKRLEQSRSEVLSLFKGIRRRKQQQSEG